jgi:hypothetical protein
MHHRSGADPHMTIAARARAVLRPHLAALALYGVVAISLLAPMASNEILPAAVDHGNHVAMIIQGRMALEEGQFPLRVAPWQHNSWRYPLYQFYSPFVYTV